MFKEYLAKYLEELKAGGVKVGLVEKNSLTMFTLWLNKNAAQHSVQRTAETYCKHGCIENQCAVSGCEHEYRRR